MIVDGAVGEDVVVGSRDGAFEGFLGQGSGPGGCFVCLGGEGELPEPVKVEEVSGGCGLGSESDQRLDLLGWC